MMRIDYKKLYTGNGGFYVVLFATLFSLFLTFSFGVDTGVHSFVFKTLSSLADSSLLLLLCASLKGRWKYLALALPFFVAIILEVNILFFRNFNDLIPASSYFHSSLSDPTVVDGALSSVRRTDVLFAVIPFMPLIYLALSGWRRLARNGGRKAWIVCSAVMAAFSWTASYAGAFRRIGIFLDMETPGEILTELFPHETTYWKFFYEEHNFTGYVIRTLFSQVGTNVTLSDDDKEYIKTYLEKKHPHPNDKMVSRGRQNLIVVVVESFPWVAMPTDSTAYIAPNIHSLTADSTVIVEKARVDVEIGQSSDAQFIFNTGLLPLRGEPLVTNHAFNDYPSIAKALQGYGSLEVIGEQGSLWSHSATTGSYGFDRLVDDIAAHEEDQDSIILAQALMQIEKMPQPFYAFVTTLSMHAPYLRPNVSSSLDPSKTGLTDPRDLEFMRRLNHFDAAFGRFVNGLKAAGLYDNSVIVVIGDHNVLAMNISPALHDDSVPLIIINSPLKPVADGRSVGQIDVFPSVLDMMGCTYIYKGMGYSGLGRSIFSSAGGDEGPTEEDYRVSELIIRSDMSRF